MIKKISETELSTHISLINRTVSYIKAQLCNITRTPNASSLSSHLPNDPLIHNERIQSTIINLKHIPIKQTIR